MRSSDRSRRCRLRLPERAMAVERASTPATAGGAALATRAFELGLAVTRADGSRRPIPIGAEPVVLDRDEIARRSAISGTLVAATAKVARAVLGGPHREAWLGALRPIERRL